MQLANVLHSFPTFHHFLQFPQVVCALPSADSQVHGLVYVLGSRGPLQQTLLSDWEFLLPPQTTQVFTARGFEALLPHIGTLGCTVCLAPQLFLPAYPHANVESPVCLLPPCPPGLLPCCASSPHSCLSMPLLPVWKKVSCLIPWLSDFHTVQFSGSFDCFLFLNLLLSFFWLCEEAKHIFLCLRLGWNHYSTFM